MNKKILIVEDELILLQALSLKLKEENFEVLNAHDGLEGLEMAEKYLPDLILLDIYMPKMDGLTMLEKVRSTPWGKDIPVIILTNSNGKEKLAEALSHWVFRYLVKSDWDLEQIVEKIKEGLNEKK